MCGLPLSWVVTQWICCWQAASFTQWSHSMTIMWVCNCPICAPVLDSWCFCSFGFLCYTSVVCQSFGLYSLTCIVNGLFSLKCLLKFIFTYILGQIDACWFFIKRFCVFLPVFVVMIFPLVHLHTCPASTLISPALLPVFPPANQLPFCSFLFSSPELLISLLVQLVFKPWFLLDPLFCNVHFVQSALYSVSVLLSTCLLCYCLFFSPL